MHMAKIQGLCSGKSRLPTSLKEHRARAPADVGLSHHPSSTTAAAERATEKTASKTLKPLARSLFLRLLDHVLCRAACREESDPCVRIMMCAAYRADTLHVTPVCTRVASTAVASNDSAALALEISMRASRVVAARALGNRWCVGVRRDQRLCAWLQCFYAHGCLRCQRQPLYWPISCRLQ